MAYRYRRLSAAFTIVELLVVIAIISILAGLLLPAVNSARESARRSTCANNMRNIGMAVMNFETRYNKYPPAFTSRFDDDPPEFDPPRHSVFAYILPFFDEAALHNKIDFSKHWNDETGGLASNYNLEHEINLGGILLCPTAPQTRFDENEATPQFQHNTLNQVSDYAPAQSLNADKEHSPRRIYFGGQFEVFGLRGLLDSHIRTDVRGAPFIGSDPNPKWKGLLQHFRTLKDARIRNADVKDGLSTTMMFFEVAGRPEHNANGQRVKNLDEAKKISGFRWASTSLPVSIDSYCRRKTMVNCENTDEVYAFHNDGAFVVFGDGSVHFVNQNIDPETFVSLYTIAGGDVVSEQEIGL